MENRVIRIFDSGVLDMFLSNVLPLKKALAFWGLRA